MEDTCEVSSQPVLQTQKGNLQSSLVDLIQQREILYSYKHSLIKYFLTLVLLFITPTIAIAQPSQAGDISVYWLYDHPVQYIEPELPFNIRSNCWEYVRYVYPDLPNTATILSNLGDSGEVAVFYYPGPDLYHYAVVESLEPFIVTDTNFSGYKKETRTMTSLRLIGFYDLPGEEG